MSIRGIVTRGVGAIVGRKVAEETGKSGVLGGLAGFGLAMLARRSPLGLATVGAIVLGKKYLDSRKGGEPQIEGRPKAEDRQPSLALEGGNMGDSPLDRTTDPAKRGDVAQATSARDPALAAGGGRLTADGQGVGVTVAS